MDKLFLKPIHKPSGEDYFLGGVLFLLIFLNLVYSLFPIRPIVYRVLILLLCGYMVIVRKKSFFLPEKIILVFLVVNFVYFMIAGVSRRMGTSTIGNALVALFPLLVTSYLAGKGFFSDRIINVVFIVLLIGSIVYYIDYRVNFIERVSRQNNLTINASSVFLFLMPLLFYIKNRYLSWTGIVICMFFIFSAVKRGNIVASIGPLLLFSYGQIKGKKSIGSRICIILAVIAGFYFLYRFALNSSYFMDRFEDTLEGDSSGRDVIYGNAYQVWANSSLIQFFFGHGFDSTIKLIGKHAHSDWLELLVDYGVFGASIYLALFVSLCLHLKHCRTFEDRVTLLSILFIWFVKSIISMAYFEPWMILLMVSLGIVLSHSKKSQFVLDSSQ